MCIANKELQTSNHINDIDDDDIDDCDIDDRDIDDCDIDYDDIDDDGSKYVPFEEQ